MSNQAFSVPAVIAGLKAGADLSTTGRFRFVKQDANGDVILASVAGEDVLGVLCNDPKLGESASVGLIGGILEVEAGVALAIGNKVMTDNVGRAIVATATNTGLGIVLTTGGAAGERVAVLHNNEGIL